MSAFVWDSSFVTGLDDVDEQHFYLVELINKFAALFVQNELSEEQVDSVFQELYNYNTYHFQEEEMLMKRAGIADHFLSRHINVHRDFLAKIMAMRSEISITNISSLKFLLDFLVHWLVYHILGMDQNMAKQLEALEKGCTAEQAYEIANTETNDATEILLNALNSLFEQVSERNSELYQLNKTLEVKVAQRTQELQEANRHLEEIAVTDVLTHLPNRRYALSHLSALWADSEQHNKPLSCLMIDADYFKQVNDKHGHDAGDKVLVQLSRLLQERLRNDDTICRLGGDEFLVICENTNDDDAKYLAQRLCNAVAQFQVNLGEEFWPGSVSIGVACKQAYMQDLDALIKIADQGVYLAKKAGRGCVKSIA